MKLAYSPAAAPPPLESQPYFELTMGFLPWRRYFARSLDNVLHLGLLVLAAFTALGGDVFKLPEGAPPLPIVVFLALALALPVSGLITALLISRLGTTVGKFIFGIHVREPGGARLTFRRALRREFLIWLGGYSLGIPLLSHIAHVIAFGYIETNHVTWWDARAEVEVTYRADNVVQRLLWIVIILLIFSRANLFAPLFS